MTSRREPAFFYTAARIVGYCCQNCNDCCENCWRFRRSPSKLYIRGGRRVTIPDKLFTLFELYTAEIALIAGLSVLLFILALFGLPLIVIAIPSNYFVRPRNHRLDRYGHPAITAILLVAKNLLGVVFIIIGIVLLFMPGQGLLAIFAGIMLLNFPGKRRLELAILCRPSIRRAIGWIRLRAKKSPLILPDECCEAESSDHQ